METDLYKRFGKQPCWHCKNYARCPWAYGVPVDGWEVTDGRVSYEIHKCPGFEYDDYVPTMPDVKETRRVFSGGQYARGFYKYSLVQMRKRTDEAKSYVTSRFKISRPRIPFEYVARYIREKGLTPTNAAMAFTGTYNAESLRQWKRLGYVKPVNPHYERIAELTGFDPFEFDGTLNKGGADDFLRLPRSEQKDAKPRGDGVGVEH